MKYSDLAKFLDNPDFYQEEYESASNTDLLDYQMILIWKTFVLFVYQKISEVRKILGDDEFSHQYWCKSSFLVKENKCKYPLEDFEITNIYSYSSISDNEIIDVVCRIFGLEKNFKQLLHTIKNDRDTASHVSSDIVKTQDQTINKNLNDAIRIAEQIDNIYKNKFLNKVNDKLMSINQSSNESELNYLIDNYFLEQIREAKNFDEAENLLSVVNKKMHLLSEESIKNILYAMLQGENNGGYIQSIDLGYSYQFLTNLLKESYKKKINLECWKDFYMELDKPSQKRFLDIRKSLEQKGIEFDWQKLKHITSEDFPF